MKVYAFGEKDRPALVLLPGTCCHWKGELRPCDSGPGPGLPGPGRELRRF